MAFDYSKGVQISLRSFRSYLVTNIKRLRYSFLIHVGYRILSIVNIMRDLELNILINRRTFKGDGIITTNFLPQDYDRDLLHAFEGSFRNLPKNQLRLTSIIWRAHIVTACAHFVRNIDGDFIELGVNWGILAHTIAEQPTLLQRRKFYLVDAFGMPGFKMEGGHKVGSYEEDIYEDVVRRFKFEPRIKIIRGIVPDILKRVKSEKIALLLIDLNHGVPERQSLDYFWNCIQPGGIVYFDDYGQNFPELRYEIDKFLQDKTEKLLIFPTGQAMLIKHNSGD